MNYQKSALTGFAVLASIFAPLNHLQAQGQLTPPPGAPVPTMKTLAQIEPRIPISSLPVGITNPGSYYLTTNLSGTLGVYSLVISSSNVTVDLNGFTLQGLPNSLTGITFLGSSTNVTICNGIIRGWSTGAAPLGANILFDHVTFENNAVCGLNMGDNCIARDCRFMNNLIGINTTGGEISGCSVRDSSQYGIEADSCLISNCRIEGNAVGIFVSDCTIRGCLADQNAEGLDIHNSDMEDCTVENNNANNASGNGINAIESSVINCVSRHNGTGVAVNDSRVMNCQIENNTVYGIAGPPAGAGKNEVRNCRICSNAGPGIYLPSGTGMFADNYIAANTTYGMNLTINGGQIQGNNCVSNTSTAILLVGTRNTIDNNTIVTSSGLPGINVFSAGSTNNVVIRNNVSGDGANGISFTTIANNVSGTIISTTSSGVITGTSPFSNFSF